MPCIQTRKMRNLIMAATLFGLTAAAAFDLHAAPNVVYIATGTFATNSSRGSDLAKLAGQPFSIRIVANEALKPTRQTQMSASYTGLSFDGAVISGLLPTPFPISGTQLSLFLELGAAGAPDVFRINFPLTAIGLSLNISAVATLPAGTLTTPAIRPFAAAVALTPTNATMTYAQAPSSTTILIASGSFNATAGPAPSAITDLYNFTGTGGSGPVGNLAFGTNGALYGTTPYGGTEGCGTVFELARPSKSAWNETVLYNFTCGNDGAYPIAGVIIDSNGTIYGTTSQGGTSNSGAVFELTPPSAAGGPWTETVLHSFTGGSSGPDGSGPLGALIQATKGVLYGTTFAGGTSNAGTVFELAPPATPGGAWTETILHSFTGLSGDGANPYAGLVTGHGGALFGTTTLGGTPGAGTVFELAPPSVPGGPWTERVLYSFTAVYSFYGYPQAPLVIGSDGTLYGTTSDYTSSVFELTPPTTPGGAWTETVLHSFQGAPDGNFPEGSLVIGKGGALYGTTRDGGLGWGTVFKLTPPAAPGGAWTETLPASFNFFDGANPTSGFVMGPAGLLYATAKNGGTARTGSQPTPYGTVFEFRP